MLLLPSPACMLHGEGSDGEFSSRFPPFLPLFSKPIKYYPVGRAGRPHSFNQGNKGLPPPFPPVRCVEKAVTLSFLSFFFHYFKCFLTAFFSIKLLFSGWLGLLFFIFISPPHLNFTMSYVPIKNVSQNFYFVLLIS